MFERFTNESRHIVVRSQEFSRKRKVPYIPTEHLLLALLDEVPDVYGLVEGNDSLKAALEASQAEGIAEPLGHIPFTPNAKKVLEMTLREGLALGMNALTPGHILLGMLRLPESGAGKALTALGVTIEDARTAVAKAGESTERLEGVSIHADTLSDIVRDLESVADRLKNLLS